jgi:sRNA-binding protein
MGWQVKTLDPEQYARAGDILERLGTRYPLFCDHPRKPLALGTGERLGDAAAQMGLTRDDIQLALIRHTRSLSYLIAVAQGGARYNLYGEIEGEVDPSQAIAAQSVIDRRREKERAAAVQRRADRAARKAAEVADSAAHETSFTRTSGSDEQGADEPRPVVTAPPEEDTDSENKTV